MEDKINKLQTTMQEFKTHLEYIKKSLDKNDKDHDVMFKKIDEWIERADKKYAPMWVASGMKYVILSMFAIVFGAIMKVILK